MEAAAGLGADLNSNIVAMRNPSRGVRLFASCGTSAVTAFATEPGRETKRWQLCVEAARIIASVPVQSAFG
jgi:diaminopimelate epimerase